MLTTSEIFDIIHSSDIAQLATAMVHWKERNPGSRLEDAQNDEAVSFILQEEARLMPQLREVWTSLSIEERARLHFTFLAIHHYGGEREFGLGVVNPEKGAHYLQDDACEGAFRRRGGWFIILLAVLSGRLEVKESR